MQLIYLQFSRFKAGVNSQYHAKRNQNLEAIMKNHQHQARIARISRPILPQSNRAEDLATWRVAQVLFFCTALPPLLGLCPFLRCCAFLLLVSFVFDTMPSSFKLPRHARLLQSLSCPRNFRYFCVAPRLLECRVQTKVKPCSPTDTSPLILNVWFQGCSGGLLN